MGAWAEATLAVCQEKMELVGTLREPSGGVGLATATGTVIVWKRQTRPLVLLTGFVESTRQKYCVAASSAAGGVKVGLVRLDATW